MRIAPLGFCVALFALLGFAGRAEANPCYYPNSSYDAPCPAYYPDPPPRPRPCWDCDGRRPAPCPRCEEVRPRPEYYPCPRCPEIRPRPQHYPCPRCPEVRRPCPRCPGSAGYPPPPPPPPTSPVCEQHLYDPGFNLYRKRVRQNHLPAVDSSGREICHFRSGDIIWASPQCASGEWCWIPLSDSGRWDAAVILP